jgi:hypothetical protein
VADLLSDARAEGFREYVADGTARHSARKMLASLNDWTDAAQFYRYDSGTENVSQPPLPLATLIAAAASHLRWLAELDGGNAPE